MLGDSNRAYLYGPAGAASVKYTGGEGTDDVRFIIREPVGAATIKLGGGDDQFGTDSGLQLERLCPSPKKPIEWTADVSRDVGRAP